MRQFLTGTGEQGNKEQGTVVSSQVASTNAPDVDELLDLLDAGDRANGT